MLHAEGKARAAQKSHLLKITKINREVVKPIKHTVIRKELVKGNKLFDEPFSNIFLCAKKKSGKTNTIFKILKECMGRDTNLIVFSSTVNKDSNWIHIVKHFKKKGNNIVTFTSIKEGKDNVLQDLINTFDDPDKNDDSDTEDNLEKPKLLIKCGNIRFAGREFVDEDNNEYKTKSKTISPDHILVFDDLSNELRNPILNHLLKTNRHYKMKIILSSQYVHDIAPEAWRQIDYVILFGGHSRSKLEQLHKRLDMSTPFELFHKMYKSATEKKFNFLYVDTINEIFRINFNKQISFDF